MRVGVGVGEGVGAALETGCTVPARDTGQARRCTAMELAAPGRSVGDAIQGLYPRHLAGAPAAAAAGDVLHAGLHGAQPPATAPPGRGAASSAGPRRAGLANDVEAAAARRAGLDAPGDVVVEPGPLGNLGPHEAPLLPGLVLGVAVPHDVIVAAVAVALGAAHGVGTSSRSLSERTAASILAVHADAAIPSHRQRAARRRQRCPGVDR